MINWNEGIQHVQPFWARIPTPETLPSEGQVPFSKTKPIFRPAVHAPRLRAPRDADFAPRPNFGAGPARAF
jgi:hypothetical protein